MSRKAILIESSNLAGATDLPGARADIETYRRLLRSDAGGKWYDSEIVTLKKPTQASLEEQLESASHCDYAFITFSGHGEHVRGRTVDETRICLNENCDLAAHKLNPGNDRCTIIVDACRNVVPEQLVEKYAKAAAMQFALGQRIK